MPGGLEALLFEGTVAYERGAYLEAHERWEDAFRSAPDPLDRSFFQALAQLGAAALKTRGGPRPAGAPALFAKAARRLAALPGWHRGIDVHAMAAECVSSADTAARALASGTPLDDVPLPRVTPP